MEKRSVEILDELEIFQKGKFRWRNVRFNFTKFDGTQAGPVERLVLDRGDSVGMILHDLPEDEIVLVEQLRIATLNSGSGWFLELPAGMVDEDEDPRQAAVREAEEETGQTTEQIEFVSTFYLSPGASSERLHLFYFLFPEGIAAKETGGLAAEHEDIRIHKIKLDRAISLLESGEIQDAKTILAIYWLKLRAEALTS